MQYSTVQCTCFELFTHGLQRARIKGLSHKNFELLTNTVGIMLEMRKSTGAPLILLKHNNKYKIVKQICLSFFKFVTLAL